ncbi:MAG: uroporphyrinogen-III synthase [Acidobacteriota bacterium]|nr:uroporphyrinogen-III synthase [Acidobacteriota bacterium]
MGTLGGMNNTTEAIRISNSFDGLRVLSLESRRAIEIATLIRNQGGDPFVAPSMREIPLSQNREAVQFAGEFDMLILLTGVGTRLLDRVLDGKLSERIKGMTVVARGPKPAAVLRELQIPVDILVPEPNTWRETLRAVEGRPERRIAVQEYGRPSPELLDGLRAQGAEVTAIPVYQYDLPEDTAPLREAVHRLADGVIDVLLFTTAVQAFHLFRVAAEEGVDILPAFQRAVVASIGPTTTEALAECGIHPDLEPTHPKMGFLVAETARAAHEILGRKR